MPANNAVTRAKHYVARLTAGASIVGISAAKQSQSGKARNFLALQNTGLNPVLFRFEEAVLLDGSDFQISPNDPILIFSDPCPDGRLSVYSALGSTLAIIEGFEP